MFLQQGRRKVSLPLTHEFRSLGSSGSDAASMKTGEPAEP